LEGNQFMAILPGCGSQFLSVTSVERYGQRLRDQWWGDRLSVTIRVAGSAIARKTRWIRYSNELVIAESD
jgi:hypothetical protein